MPDDLPRRPAEVSFLVSLQDTSGITRHGTGAVVRLDVPETEILAMLPLNLLTNTVLRVTFTEEPAPDGLQPNHTESYF